MKIIGDITDISKQKSRNMFYVTNSEFYNAERARLKIQSRLQSSNSRHASDNA